MKRQILLNTLAFVTSLLCALTSTAYDFEVDGIYYNITSPNTVEVTFKDRYVDYEGFCDYSGSVVIPSYVLRNNIMYHVTAIGDSAFFSDDFYDYYSLKNVVIPESVHTIGKAAFYCCCGMKSITIPKSVTTIKENAFGLCIQLTDVTCLAQIPPQNEGNFPIHTFDNNFYNLSINSDLVYDEVDFRPWLVLYVPSEVCDQYKNSPQWSVFNWIIPIDAEKTAVPILNTGIRIENGSLVFWSIDANESCSVYSSSKGAFSDSPYYTFNSWSECASGGHGNVDVNGTSFRGYDLEVSAFAIEDGKKPSEVVYGDVYFKPYSYEYNTTDGYVCNLLIQEYLGEYSSTFYDFKVDGVCYNVVNDTSVIVAPNVYKCGSIYNKYYYNTTLSNFVDNVSYHRDRSYDESVIIPSSVQHSGQLYNVVGLDGKAFSSCYYENDNVIEGYGGIGYYIGSVSRAELNSITLPTSITSIVEGTFEDICLESVFIHGEGEWLAGALVDTVKTLYIGGGVTGVNGLRINPDVIYSYATTPPICDDNSFTCYDAELHVPASSLAAYFTAPYWCNFTNIIADAVAITDLTLNLDSVAMLAGEQLTLRATFAPAGAVPNTVLWRSTDSTVVKVNNGVITGLNAGECDIIATCQDKQSICHVVVNEILPEEVLLNQEDTKIEVGTQLVLTATVLPENATNNKVNWQTTNSAVATVSSDGVVTALSPGECYIVATCGDKQAICHLIVVEHLIYITFDQHDASLLPNHILTLTPTVTPMSTDLVVTSNNPAVAAARLAGNKIQVVGVSEGMATIYVNSADGYAFNDSCRVEVYTERGDVNGDGYVNISDLTELIDVLLSGDANYSVENADCNNDGNVTIVDATALIDALLGGAPLPDKNIEVFIVNGVTFKMVKVPGGMFTMGATAGQGDMAYSDELPTHQVTLSTYSIGETEVTQALWQAVMGANPSNFNDNPARPVECVTWAECQTFIVKINQLTGKTFRLPTEAEWEYAARGGHKTHDYMYAGSDDISQVCWAITTIPSQQAGTIGYGTQPVAQLAPNELGLYDMSGNVYEWCSDWYDAYPVEAQVNPTGPSDDEGCHYRITRGGAWSRYDRSCRVTLRNNTTPESSYFNIGLRLVK